MRWIACSSTAVHVRAAETWEASWPGRCRHSGLANQLSSPGCRASCGEIAWWADPGVGAGRLRYPAPTRYLRQGRDLFDLRRSTVVHNLHVIARASWAARQPV
jgi:hypothetical protein